MFRSFFPQPKLFFTSALIWTAFAMVVWFTVGPALANVISLAPLLAQVPTEADPNPFLTADKVWLYQYVLMVGYLFCVPWYFIGNNRRWYWWSVVGSVTIIEVVFFDVQIGAWMNSWYGEFYNMLQAAMTTPGSPPPAPTSIRRAGAACLRSGAITERLSTRWWLSICAGSRTAVRL